MAIAITDPYLGMRDQIIKNVTTINIMHHNSGENSVWVKSPGMQEMKETDELDNLVDFIDMLRMEPSNPVLHEALEQARVIYKLSKKYG